MKGKKGQSLPIEVIVVGVLLLVVLVVLIVIFSEQSSDFLEDIEKCTIRGGQEMVNENECQSKGGIVIFKFKDVKDIEKVCCIVGK